jgi:hypothetical protein
MFAHNLAVKRVLGCFLIGFLVSNSCVALESEHSISSEIFSSHYDINYDSPFNPENSLANFPERELNFLTRLNWSASLGGFDLMVAPRFGVESISSEQTWTDTYSYMQEWSLSYGRDNGLVSVGRELILWGGSQFSSPSNPFYASNNQSNPFIEPPARDFFQAQWINEKGWDLHFMANFDEGRDAINFDEFINIYAMKFGYTNYESSSALIVSSRNGSIDIGFYGQWTANDATLLYLDSSYAESRNGYYPELTDGNSQWQFSKRTESTYEYDVLIGSSYTFKSGSTLNVEYRYNEAGYDSQELNTYYQLVDMAALGLQASDPTIIINSVSLLAMAADPKLRSINRNYLHLQYFHRNIIKDLSVNLLISHNLDDHSSQLTPVLNYYLNNNIAISGNFIFGLGDQYGEYSRYLDKIFYVGFKYYF